MHVETAMTLHPIMNRIESVAGTDEVQFSQTSALRRDFELHRGADRIAALHWESRFGSLATGTATDGAWTFKRVWFLRPVVTARRVGTSEDLLVFKPRWNGHGTAFRRDGVSLRWAQADFWQSRWVFLNPADEVVLSIRRHASLRTLQASVALGPAARRAGQLELVALLGCYLLVLMDEDLAGTGAAIAAC
jgi:hypothetical protein